MKKRTTLNLFLEANYSIEEIRKIKTNSKLLLIRHDLIQLRKKLGFTQRDIANKLNITQVSVSDFERGDSDMKLTTLIDYLYALNCNLELNITGTNIFSDISQKINLNTIEVKMVYLLIIKDDLVDYTLAHSFEFDEYNFLPDANGKPIYFNEEGDAHKFILNNIKENMIYPETRSNIPSLNLSDIEKIRGKFFK